MSAIGDMRMDVRQILRVIEDAGPDAVIVANDCGAVPGDTSAIRLAGEAVPDCRDWATDLYDVLVWESEEDAENDAGERAVGRWTVSEAVLAAIRASGVREI